MLRILSATILALAIMVALPMAAAEENPEDPEDKAWVDDCPPDQMCAFGGAEEEPQSYGDEGCIECSGPVDEGGDEPTYSGDCGGEVCAYDEPVEDSPETRGPEDCEYCRGGNDTAEPGSIDGSNCMDGQQEGEDCRDDVLYMTPPKTGDGIPEGAVAKGDETDAQADEKRDVPGPGLVLAALGMLAAGLIVMARKD